MGSQRCLPLLLLLLITLQGCNPLPLIWGDTLNVLVVTQKRLDWLRRSDKEEHLWRPQLQAYQRLHPEVRMSLSTISEEEVVAKLRQSTSRGLGPDLILLRAPMANTLLKKGLIAPVPDIPALRGSIAQVGPSFLSRVRMGDALSGLPVHDEVTLACYNRSRVPTPPATTEDLLALAASGRTVGLSIDPIGIWWSAGALRADRVVGAILLGEPLSSALAPQEGELAIVAWLSFLRALANQNRVDVSSGPEELTTGLISGRLDWIPCISRAIGTLKAGMGSNLGVTTLPRGPGGPPSPLNTLIVWSFGLDSSARQRRHAADFAQLSLDPLLQRRSVLESQEVLPVNRYVQTPVASSGILAALAAAQENYEMDSPMVARPFTMEHLSKVVKPMESVVRQVMVGILTPSEGARQIMGMGAVPK